jgi:hypothetical protein
MIPLVLALLAPIAAPPAQDSLVSARAALEDGMPQATISKISAVSPKVFKGREDPALTLLMADALIKAGRAAEAEKLLRLANLPSPDANFLLAQALAALGRHSEALPLYESVAQKSGAVNADAATIGAARMVSLLGRPNEAIKILAPAFEWPPGPARSLALLDLAEVALNARQTELAAESIEASAPTDSLLRMRRDFLKARCLAATGKNREAVALFESVTPVDNTMAVAGVIAHATALRALGRSPDAENLLENFVESHPNIPHLDRVMAALDEVYAKNGAASSSELKRWADDQTNPARSALACFYLALFDRRQNATDTAIDLFQRFLASTPTGSLARRAAVELATAQLEEGRPNDALAVLPPAGSDPSSDFVRGLALSVLADPDAAANAFRLAARSAALAESALFNAAFCELQVPGGKKPSASDLRSRFPTSSYLNRLELADALHCAKNRDAQAPDRLARIAATTDSSSAPRAALALAEWKFIQGNPGAARLDLTRISTTQQPAEKAALEVFLADSGAEESPDAAIDAAIRFLKDFPDSKPAVDVQMKLGELLFRRGDFGGARVQFEDLARKQAGTPIEETALFLAAQASSRLLESGTANDAILLFEEVASLNGTFALRARFEQAVIQNAQGRPNQALAILDRILASQPDPDTRFRALIEKGKTQFLAAAGDPARLREAIASWKLVAQDPQASPLWKNQALSRMGTACEKLGDTDSAIAAFYDVIRPAGSGPEEFFWFYKAGFDAARILESAQRWEEAIRVYQIIAGPVGPRAEEARSRINKIRLENFLWEDK